MIIREGTLSKQETIRTGDKIFELVRVHSGAKMKVQEKTDYRSVKILMLTMAGVLMSIPAFAQNRQYIQRDTFPVPTPPATLDDETEQEDNTNTQPMLKNRPMLKPVPRMKRGGVEQSAYVVPPPGDIRAFR